MFFEERHIQTGVVFRCRIMGVVPKKGLKFLSNRVVCNTGAVKSQEIGRPAVIGALYLKDPAVSRVIDERGSWSFEGACGIYPLSGCLGDSGVYLEHQLSISCGQIDSKQFDSDSMENTRIT